jgi:hypothetical protein
MGLSLLRGKSMLAEALFSSAEFTELRRRP